LKMIRVLKGINQCLIAPVVTRFKSVMENLNLSFNSKRNGWTVLIAKESNVVVILHRWVAHSSPSCSAVAVVFLSACVLIYVVPLLCALVYSRPRFVFSSISSSTSLCCYRPLFIHIFFLPLSLYLLSVVGLWPLVLTSLSLSLLFVEKLSKRHRLRWITLESSRSIGFWSSPLIAHSPPCSP
jgi:hypothetical protein